MKTRLSLWQFAGFAFTSLLGTLLHFAYDFTNQSPLVIPFSAVNESTWEHMKLLYFPMLIFAFIENKHLKGEYKNLMCIKLQGIILGVILIPTLFYTFNGVFGKTPDYINILIFFAVSAIVYAYEAYKLKKESSRCISEKTSTLILLIIGAILVTLTYFPPKIPLFQDPVTNLYGI